MPKSKDVQSPSGVPVSTPGTSTKLPQHSRHHLDNTGIRDVDDEKTLREVVEKGEDEETLQVASELLKLARELVVARRFDIKGYYEWIANLKVGDKVQVRWTWGGGYYAAEAKIKKLKADFERALKRISRQFGVDYDAAQEDYLEELGNATD